jgi:hypothetical protein
LGQVFETRETAGSRRYWEQDRPKIAERAARESTSRGGTYEFGSTLGKRRDIRSILLLIAMRRTSQPDRREQHHPGKSAAMDRRSDEE